ncbi:type II secretion system protein N [Pseudomonas sp. T1.Ur]|uniref:type II secretion system protein N n=1 Tax=Pseudomonas sp. T1.Ur TaxID=2928704 RepID=UPI00201DDBD8|nr:type II secretion system protein N [Pseudomonas sp. T1.Ur]MCL6704249.1 hypothetical protein [Pseudomonas sp. T1.Ur]
MRFFIRAGHRRPTALLVLIPVLYGFFLACQEWRFRQALQHDLPTPSQPKATVARDRPHVQAVATVLGLTPQTALSPSAESITLQASFVAAPGLSRALLADATGPRFYQVGERLPGGSVLRRVEAGQVMLWRNGREERLVLRQQTGPSLRRLDLDGSHATLQASQHLRPIVGQSE